MSELPVYLMRHGTGEQHDHDKAWMFGERGDLQIDAARAPGARGSNIHRIFGDHAA